MPTLSYWICVKVAIRCGGFRHAIVRVVQLILVSKRFLGVPSFWLRVTLCRLAVAVWFAVRIRSANCERIRLSTSGGLLCRHQTKSKWFSAVRRPKQKARFEK